MKIERELFSAVIGHQSILDTTETWIAFLDQIKTPNGGNDHLWIWFYIQILLDFSQNLENFRQKSVF